MCGGSHSGCKLGLVRREVTHHAGLYSVNVQVGAKIKEKPTPTVRCWATMRCHNSFNAS